MELVPLGYGRWDNTFTLCCHLWLGCMCIFAKRSRTSKPSYDVLLCVRLDYFLYWGVFFNKIKLACCIKHSQVRLFGYLQINVANLISIKDFLATLVLTLILRRMVFGPIIWAIHLCESMCTSWIKLKKGQWQVVTTLICPNITVSYSPSTISEG